jgi:hypothetical protein
LHGWPAAVVPGGLIGARAAVCAGCVAGVVAGVVAAVVAALTWWACFTRRACGACATVGVAFVVALKPRCATACRCGALSAGCCRHAALHAT